HDFLNIFSGASKSRVSCFQPSCFVFHVNRASKSRVSCFPSARFVLPKKIPNFPTSFSQAKLCSPTIKNFFPIWLFSFCLLWLHWPILIRFYKEKKYSKATSCNTPEWQNSKTIFEAKRARKPTGPTRLSAECQPINWAQNTRIIS